MYNSYCWFIAIFLSISKGTVNDKENPNTRKTTTKNHLKIKAFATIKQFQEKVLLKFRKKDNGQYISQQMVEGVNVPGLKQPVQMESTSK